MKPQVEKKLLETVKNFGPYFNKVREDSNNQVTNWDIGYNMQEKRWECFIQLWDKVDLSFIAETPTEVYDTMEMTLDRLGLIKSDLI
jgi:hypothetical protein